MSDTTDDKPVKRGPGRPRKNPKPPGPTPEQIEAKKPAFGKLRRAVKSKDLESAMWALCLLGIEEMTATGKVGMNGRDITRLLVDLGKATGETKPPDESPLADWFGTPPVEVPPKEEKDD